ncbi:MAG: hypothetical protein JO264_15915 [Acidisphaera sp.]|nr:hypothetical protein [Acidisphaera sp.]
MPQSVHMRLSPAVGAMLAGLALMGQAPAALVTTDTPDYCVQLRTLVGQEVHAAPVTPPPEVQLLSDEGQHMCDQGKVRGGIARLRRALVLMHQMQAK